MDSDEQNWLRGSWIQTNSMLPTLPHWRDLSTYPYTGVTVTSYEAPLYNWCREDGPSRVGLVLGSVFSLEKAKRLSCPPWEAEGPTLEVPLRCSIPQNSKKTED